jgi:hypothetical protein
LAICAVPSFVFGQDHVERPVLTRAELSAYAVHCLCVENPARNCTVTLSVNQLLELTGFSAKNVVRDALAGLEEKRFLRIVGERKEGSNSGSTRELTNPHTGDGFSLDSPDRRNFTCFRTALKQAGIGYFNIPQDVVHKIPEKNSATFALFTAVARVLNIEGTRDAEVLTSRLRTMSGLSHHTFDKSLADLNGDWLDIDFGSSRRTVKIVLLDPTSKNLLVSFEDQQNELDAAERKKKFDENLLKREHTDVQLLAWSMWILDDITPRGPRNGEFFYWCPVCRNQVTSKGRKQARPRFSVNVSKGSYGLWHCFDCGIGGTLLKLAEQRRGGTWDARKMLHDIEKEKPTLYASALKLLDGYKTDLPLHMMLK